MDEGRQDKLEPIYHRFDNGLLVEDACLIEVQRQRYATQNLHEPVEEEWILRLCRDSTNTPFIFWDVGAAIGYYSMLVATHRPDAIVHAFEPLPKHAEALRRHWALNSLDPHRLSLHEHAVGAASGTSHLVDANFGSQLARGAVPPKAIPVTVVTVDEMLHKLNTKVDLIKVDVQGFENDVLLGAAGAAGRVRAWVVGTHGQAIHRVVHDLFVAQGYKIILSEDKVPGQPDGLVIATWPSE